MAENVNVTVRYFAAAADAAGREHETIELQSGSTIADLKSVLVERYGEPMERVTRSGSFLVGKTVRRDPSHPLADTVDVLPPFAGG